MARFFYCNYWGITTGEKVNSIIIQFLIERIFKEIKGVHTSKTVFHSPNDDALTYDEWNALRYAASYVPKCLRNHLKHSGHPLKRELMWRLLNLTDESDDVIEDDEIKY